MAADEKVRAEKRDKRARGGNKRRFAINLLSAEIIILVLEF
jgi:hypothetical protein